MEFTIVKDIINIFIFLFNFLYYVIWIKKMLKQQKPPDTVLISMLRNKYGVISNEMFLNISRNKIHKKMLLLWVHFFMFSRDPLSKQTLVIKQLQPILCPFLLMVSSVNKLWQLLECIDIFGNTDSKTR